MAKERRPSVAPIYAVGVTWLIWSLVLPLYQPLHWFGAAAASLAVYVLGRCLIWKDRVLIVPDEPEQKEPEERQRPRRRRAKIRRSQPSRRNGSGR